MSGRSVSGFRPVPSMFETKILVVNASGSSDLGASSAFTIAARFRTAAVAAKAPERRMRDLTDWIPVAIRFSLRLSCEMPAEASDRRHYVDAPRGIQLARPARDRN